MDLIRREDVLRLIVAAGGNHATAIRAEEEKAAASGVKLAAYSYVLSVLATLGVIVHDIPVVNLVPTDPDPCEDEGSPTTGEEEVHLYA